MLPWNGFLGFLKVRTLSLADGGDKVAYLLKTDKGALIELDIHGNLAAYKRVSRMFPGTHRCPYAPILFHWPAIGLPLNSCSPCLSIIQEHTCRSMGRSATRLAARQ